MHNTAIDPVTTLRPKEVTGLLKEIDLFVFEQLIKYWGPFAHYLVYMSIWPQRETLWSQNDSVTPYSALFILQVFLKSLIHC